jgi:hypothetical protein
LFDVFINKRSCKNKTSFPPDIYRSCGENGFLKHGERLAEIDMARLLLILLSSLFIAGIKKNRYVISRG